MRHIHEVGTVGLYLNISGSEHSVINLLLTKLMQLSFWLSRYFRFQVKKRVIMNDFIERESITTADVFCETLTKLTRAIQNRLRGKLLSCLILVLANEISHTAALSKKKIQNFL